jgi:chemotaxis protein methyltransferase CheR
MFHDPSPLPVSEQALSRHDFQRLAEFIHARSGIRLPPAKKTLVEGRLRRRVHALGLSGLDDYCHYLFGEDGVDEGEAVRLIDAITTNKTDFFREANHFRFLAEAGVEHLVSLRKAGSMAALKFWSAGCSIGAEPYSLAMVLEDLRRERGDFRFNILGTDICTEVLRKAALSIYSEEMISPVPRNMLRRYVMRSREPGAAQVRIVPELRHVVRFAQVNLIAPPYDVPAEQDVIFCRNLLIYFDKATQEAVLQQLCEHLRPGGFLIVGHSESIAGFKLPVRPVATGVFVRSE